MIAKRPRIDTRRRRSYRTCAVQHFREIRGLYSDEEDQYRSCFLTEAELTMVDDDRTNRSQSDETDRAQRRALIVAGVVVAIIVIGVLLERELASSAKLQDCLLSGRTNCAPIDVQH
jgi:hypothetical protein